MEWVMNALHWLYGGSDSESCQKDTNIKNENEQLDEMCRALEIATHTYMKKMSEKEKRRDDDDGEIKRKLTKDQKTQSQWQNA